MLSPLARTNTTFIPCITLCIGDILNEKLKQRLSATEMLCNPTFISRLCVLSRMMQNFGLVILMTFFEPMWS